MKYNKNNIIYTLYEIKDNNDIKYIKDYETTEEIAEDLKKGTRAIQKNTYRSIDDIDFIQLKENGNDYIIIKEIDIEYTEIKGA